MYQCTLTFTYIYHPLPSMIIPNHPFTILLNGIFVARSSAGFLFDHHDFAIATWLQWFHLSNGDQAIKGEVPSNNWELAMLLRMQKHGWVYDFL